ncbi:MAG: SDR family NAD(P)-dependent oxidoreductase [Pirellulaceae bacterium]|nr:SDR family NAD(P)-dependent oxidoreductase [Planctomycetales bacterium]
MFENRRVAITGASSGIGRALASQFAQRRARLLLNARRADRLVELAEQLRAEAADLQIVGGDITDPETRAAMLESARTHWDGLDILVNNAGIGALGPFAQAGSERMRQVFETNVFAPIELIRVFLPTLRQSPHARIVNVCSVLGHRGVPGKSEYCASKFAMHGFSDALRAELQREGIRVLLVSPSTTESEFFGAVVDGATLAHREGKGAMSAAAVARATLRAIERNKHEVILSLGGKCLVWFDRLLPTLADWAVARFGQTPSRRGGP